MTTVVIAALAGAAVVVLVGLWMRLRGATAASSAAAERHRALLASLPSAAALDAEDDLRWRLVEGEGRAQFLGAAIERLPESVLVCDAEGHVVVVNAAARALHGFSAAEVDSSSSPLDGLERIRLWELGGRRVEPARLPLFRALQGEVVVDEPYMIDTGAGRRRMLVSAGPVVAPDGTRLGAAGISVDVTSAHADALALQASEARYRSIVDGVDDAVFQADASGRFTFLNDAFERWTGFGVDAAIGRPAWEFVHPDDRTAHGQAFAPLLSGRASTLRHRHRYLTADGAVRWAEVRARVVPGSGIAGVIQDVTDRRQAEEHDIVRDEVVEILSSPSPGTVSEAVTAVLGVLCRGLDWEAAELWTKSPDDEVLAPSVWWRSASSSSGLGAPGEFSLEVGEGLPGQAWALRRPVWVEELAASGESAGCPRAAAAVACGARSALLLPVVSGRRVRALIVLLSSRDRAEEAAAARPLDAIATRIALFLERADAEDLIARQALDLAELRARLHG
jgi:PAS domain S-box-containing protein